MMGPAHRLAGVLAGACYGWVHSGHPWPMLLAATAGGITAAGALSPDVDRTLPWRYLAKLLPEHLGHRGLTHWWPVLLAWWLALPLAPAGAWAALIGGAWAGWSSHIVGDGVFGKVPLLPTRRGWVRVGVGLPTGSPWERWVVLAGFAALVWAIA